MSMSTSSCTRLIFSIAHIGDHFCSSLECMPSVSVPPPSDLSVWLFVCLRKMAAAEMKSKSGTDGGDTINIPTEEELQKEGMYYEANTLCLVLCACESTCFNLSPAWSYRILSFLLKALCIDGRVYSLAVPSMGRISCT